MSIWRSIHTDIYSQNIVKADWQEWWRIRDPVISGPGGTFGTCGWWFRDLYFKIFSLLNFRILTFIFQKFYEVIDLFNTSSIGEPSNSLKICKLDSSLIIGFKAILFNIMVGNPRSIALHLSRVAQSKVGFRWWFNMRAYETFGIQNSKGKKNKSINKQCTGAYRFVKDYATVCMTLAPRLVKKARLQN